MNKTTDFLYSLWQGVGHPVEQGLPGTLLPFLSLQIAVLLVANTVEGTNRTANTMTQIL